MERENQFKLALRFIPLIITDSDAVVGKKKKQLFEINRKCNLNT